MITNFYYGLAVFVLALHLLFNAWVVFGALVTRGRPRLEGLHIFSLLYGAVMENGPWPCPLTLAEKWFLGRAGIEPYPGPFLIHYLRAVVDPNFPDWLLGWGAIGVCAANVAIYVRRYRHAHRHAASRQSR